MLTRAFVSCEDDREMPTVRESHLHPIARSHPFGVSDIPS